MTETILRQRRAMRRAVARAVIVVAMCAFAAPFAVSAQAMANTAAQSKQQSQSKNVHPRVLLMPQAHFGAPLGSAVGGSILIARKWNCEDVWCGVPGIEIHGMTGAGGWRVGGGAASIGVIWADALVTVTHTRSEPRRASSDSTYVGLEGGFGFPFYGKGDSVLSVRPSIGVARRVDGSGPSSERTTFTWNVGASLMLPTRWFVSGG